SVPRNAGARRATGGGRRGGAEDCGWRGWLVTRGHSLSAGRVARTGAGVPAMRAAQRGSLGAVLSLALRAPLDPPRTRGGSVGARGEAAGGGVTSVMATEAVAGKTGPDAFRVLGPLEVLRSGDAVPLGGPRQRAVLALLLLQANQVVSRDRLVEDVWEGHAPAASITTLQTYVSHLRRALEPGR